MRKSRDGYWNGRTDREIMLDEVLHSRKRLVWMVVTVVLQAFALLFLAVMAWALYCAWAG